MDVVQVTYTIHIGVKLNIHFKQAFIYIQEGYAFNSCWAQAHKSCLLESKESKLLQIFQTAAFTRITKISP